jgi:hypothetical protein
MTAVRQALVALAAAVVPLQMLQFPAAMEQ